MSAVISLHLTRPPAYPDQRLCWVHGGNQTWTSRRRGSSFASALTTGHWSVSAVRRRKRSTPSSYASRSIRTAMLTSVCFSSSAPSERNDRRPGCNSNVRSHICGRARTPLRSAGRIASAAPPLSRQAQDWTGWDGCAIKRGWCPHPCLVGPHDDSPGQVRAVITSGLCPPVSTTLLESAPTRRRKLHDRAFLKCWGPALRAGEPGPGTGPGTQIKPPALPRSS